MENQNTNTEPTGKVAKVKKEKAPKVVKTPGIRGRKTNPESKRQQRLAKFAEIKANGGTVKRGRPSIPDAEKKVKAPKAKKEKAPKAEEKTA